MLDAPRYDVFLSYNSRDRPMVRELYQRLEPRFSIWFDEEDLPPGSVWMEEIEAGLAGARCVVVCLGAEGLGDWQKPESQVAVNLAVEQRKRIIPVLLPGSPGGAEGFLSRFTHCDLRDGLSEAGIANLARGIEKARGAAGPPGGSSTDSDLGPPPLHNLPFDSLGPMFQGRAEDLARLERVLAQGPAAAIGQRSKATILGLGGIGKTRLAIEYAWRYGVRYTAVLFLRVDSPAALSANLAGLARLPWIDLAVDPESGEAVAVRGVLRWLHEHPGWLMILDNVDDKEAAQAVRELLPHLTTGRVLITSRWSAWPISIGHTDLETLGPPEAAQFLLDHTVRRIARADDPAEARKLAEALGGLPLALEQAAAYVNK